MKKDRFLLKKKKQNKNKQLFLKSNVFFFIPLTHAEIKGLERKYSTFANLINYAFLITLFKILLMVFI